MEQDLRVYAKGLAFCDGVYDLRTLESLITNYRKIFDRLIAVQLGKRQVSPELKSQLDYDVKIQSGSIELLINFVLEHREYIAVFSADGGAALSKAIVTLLRDAINLREKASQVIEKGLTLNINIANSFNIGSSVNNGNVFGGDNGDIYIRDPKILWAAQTTRSPVNGLLSHVDGKAVEFIDVDSKEDTFRFDPDQRHIVGKSKEELPTTLKILGRLDMVAFTSHRGSIVSDGERFNVTWDDQIRKKMQKIADIEGVVFTVRPVVDHKRLNNEAIGFHVLDCGDPQQSLKV
ncbi:hypothetical protein EHN06_15920 [Marinobacter sp. NP-4(2019)]|uniref:hypothetical protein n=1 Tax=Marinobacter sp. NP-4(2019) TaxID=2488665 RepID=UPI000FC3DE4E|nr:hypothetical protein [Marinobacter sp. NP-4(2019)]AZT84917.1 hypothetical protein EHN06_15920 [Marinobacter sp. NP-4(2019)]